MKKFPTLFLITALLLTACAPSQAGQTAPPQAPQTEQTVSTTVPAPEEGRLDLLELTLPEGMERTSVSDTCDSFLQNGTQAGGVFLLDVSDSAFGNVLGYSAALEPPLLEALTQLGLPQSEWSMGGSSVYGIYELNMGSGQSEYIAYVLRGASATYVVWFDRGRISQEDERAAMESLRSPDIAPERNKTTTEAFMDALSESMDGKSLTFQLSLPQGMTLEEASDAGALLCRDGKTLGGYTVVHFEKGILPDAYGNQQRIIDSLKAAVSPWVDLSDFRGEITDDKLVTVAFTSEEACYTHYILSYGQIGTQYDLWLDTEALDQNTVQALISGASLVERAK